ncbi:hypothetical protein GH714_003523 [Hevea brasiliensis]|uniref:Rad21/Rec8-like protein N-terminal domain-containing protein n=1 Tax=Hevea brasiliensis TaxID=3981 RepID=A0A6A6KX88_HEVBR|nr:hypothetical protein GH714_003523 [Hevea brasiliensis]
MSGHLLLGVVRIYAKKVDYLYHDCNVILIGLRKDFASTVVNLPENATAAKFESVTLPQTLDLDALDVDFDVYPDGSPDNHTRSQDEITLQDQIPTGRDPYVVITLDEDIMMDVLPPEQDTNSVNHRLRLWIFRSWPSNQTELQDPGPSNQTGFLNSVLNDGNFPPEIEVMRDPVHGFNSENLPPVFPGHQNDASESNKSLDQGLDQKEIPSKEDTLLSRGHSSPFQQCSEPPKSSASQEAPESLIHVFHLVYEKALENSIDILRKRREIPSTALGIWKLNNALRKERVFYEPLLTGSLFFINCFSWFLIVNFLLYNFKVDNYTRTPAFSSQSYAFSGKISVFSFRRGDFTPKSAKSLGSETLPWAGASTGAEVLPTPDVAASTGTYTTELETPSTFFKEQFDIGHTGLSDIPESINTAETGDLYFWKLTIPQLALATQGIDSLSVRTRAVAQYLKGYSPITPVSEDHFGDLSLNKILQGKTRKLCARMFFEILVLKSYGLIDVQQEQPYGDVALKLTSIFSKAQI